MNPVDAIGKKIKFSRVEAEIVGVVKDFHTASLQDEVGPVVLSNMYQRFFVEAQIKTTIADYSETVDYIKATWEDVFPGYSFDYNFLEEFVANLYGVEENFFDMMKIFAFIAILIGCLGLLGLVSFVTVQKTKEIGVRKVLVAKINDILIIISKDFTKDVIIANVIAWPIAWYFMNKWLQEFAYRISIEWWMFVIAGLAAILITLFTVSFQSIKAAISNPVEALKYE